MIVVTIALLGSIAAGDFANDYNRGVDRAHERQTSREIDRLNRSIERLERALKGAQAERDFWHNDGQGRFTCGGGGRVDGRGGVASDDRRSPPPARRRITDC